MSALSHAPTTDPRPDESTREPDKRILPILVRDVLGRRRLIGGLTAGFGT
jgi:hypothetical protein